MTRRSTTRARGEHGVRRGGQIGAGIGVAVAAFAFLVTRQPAGRSGCPRGWAGSAAIAVARNRMPAFDAAAARASGGKALRWLDDDRLAVRFAKLLGPAVVLFVVTWLAAYAFLPERALVAANSVRADAISETVAPTLWAEWFTIAAVNLLPLLGIALVSLLLGHRYAALLVMTWVVHYAVMLGTNSFGVPLSAPMAP